MRQNFKFWIRRPKFWWNMGAPLPYLRFRWYKRHQEPSEDAPIIQGGKRLGMYQSAVLGDWWVGWSPRNGLLGEPEGPWEHWLNLAHLILALDRERHGLPVDWDQIREEHRQEGRELVEIGAKTRVPAKYRLVDLETGDIWGFDEEGHTKRVTTGTYKEPPVTG